jgi:hypothetical protein
MVGTGGERTWELHATRLTSTAAKERGEGIIRVGPLGGLTRASRRYEVEQRGIEHEPTSAPSVVERSGNNVDRAAEGAARRPEVSASGDVVEAALARAIEAEVDARLAGWEARVGLLAGELQARRLARGGVVALDARKRQRR